MKINLSKALKIKNRIVQKLNSEIALLLTHNSTETGTLPLIDIDPIYNNILFLRKRLAVLKSAISRANAAEIVDLIYLMAESKAHITTLSSVYSKPDMILSYSPVINKTAYTHFIDDIRKGELIAEETKKINKYQDQIDEFNASTFIDVDIPDDIVG